MRKKRRRRFYHEAVNHVYQRTVGGLHLFYCAEDCIVYYTIFAVCARSCNVRVLELCLMHNHVHFLINTDSIQELSHFVDYYTSWFVREYNSHVGRKGRLFKKNFGSAPKRDEKRLRSAIIYVGNNPVEKRFCRTAKDYRWNFLAYMQTDNPFSSPLIKREASHEMRKVLKEVDYMNDMNLPLRYAQLKRMTQKLSAKEYEQFIDYVISKYSPMDYESLVSHFKSYDAMIMAMNSTTGDDFDIKESRDDFSPEVYNEIVGYISKKMDSRHMRRLTVIPLEEKMAIRKEILANTSAPDRQICRFLHITTETSG